MARCTIRIDFIIYNRVPVFYNDIIAGVKQAFADLHDFNVLGEIHEFFGEEYTVHQQGYMAVEQMYHIISESAIPDSTLFIQPNVILQSNIREYEK